MDDISPALTDTADEVAPGRLDGGGAVAVIDIGSNSVRLVVYERLCRAPTPLFNEKALCGLGRSVAHTGRLDESAVTSALDAIRRFVALSRQMGVVDLHIFATAAAREADNGAEFVAAVERVAGREVALLTGREEARLSALGVISGFHFANGVAGDLGGGSLEVVDVKVDQVGPGETFPLGGLRLEDAAGKTIKKADKIVAQTLDKSSVLANGKGRSFYAIGGTWRSLARLHMRQTGYPLHVMHHYRLEPDEALEFCRMVAYREVDSLASIEAVSRNRRPLLPYGALVLQHVVKTMKPSEVVMSALGVREGHLFDLLEPAEQREDPLLAAADELAQLRSRSPRHARELSPWAGQVLAALGVDETDEEARLREAACLLADIGWRAHPEYRGEQSLNIIAHGNFIGIDHPGRAYLALAIYYRHVGLIDAQLSPRIRELASTRLMERARTLGATLRVAYLISGAMPGVIGRTRIELRDKALTLVLPEDLGDLAGERLLRRLGQLAKLAGREPAIAIE